MISTPNILLVNTWHDDNKGDSAIAMWITEAVAQQRRSPNLRESLTELNRSKRELLEKKVHSWLDQTLNTQRRESGRSI